MMIKNVISDRLTYGQILCNPEYFSKSARFYKQWSGEIITRTHHVELSQMQTRLWEHHGIRQLVKAENNGIPVGWLH